MKRSIEQGYINDRILTTCITKLHVQNTTLHDKNTLFFPCCNMTNVKNLWKKLYENEKMPEDTSCVLISSVLLFHLRELYEPLLTYTLSTQLLLLGGNLYN